MRITRTPLPVNASPFAKQKEIAEQARQVMRLREFAANATTARVKARLLDEAAALERMVKQPGLYAHPVPVVSIAYGRVRARCGERKRSRANDRIGQ